MFLGVGSWAVLPGQNSVALFQRTIVSDGITVCVGGKDGDGDLTFRFVGFGPHDDGGNAADTIWKRYALTQATVRLAALTGDARLKEHLPALDERLMGTAIEGDLRTAYDRVGDQ